MSGVIGSSALAQNNVEEELGQTPGQKRFLLHMVAKNASEKIQLRKDATTRNAKVIKS